ncbi:hypothetical protein IEQ34_014001 [Dendrobium chrysotoxum]|uniref:Uncharacterized protein n=1 Tax=Dendrobium chrysotoxum TaxID=161865 RepID=A0AAV7GKA4_DENCH|nr:hypothetical protein IEQ34_014001 [Dendrobium chrysotoxum]
MEGEVAPMISDYTAEARAPVVDRRWRGDCRGGWKLFYIEEVMPDGFELKAAEHFLQDCYRRSCV